MRMRWELASLLGVVLILQGSLLAFSEESKEGLKAAVDAYRRGEYIKAESALKAVCQAQPENLGAIYYLAMTEAQLGRFQQARGLYQSIMDKDANSEVAHLAAEGLRYLPKDDVFDPPPRFDGSQPAQVPAQTAASPFGNMSPQDMMAMQMMMQMGGGGKNGGGFNPMMMGLMQGGQTGQNVDPEVLSTMMMNQMMENFSLGDNSKNDD